MYGSHEWKGTSKVLSDALYVALGGQGGGVRCRMWQSMRCSVLVHAAMQGSELGQEHLGPIAIEYQAWQT